MKSEPVYCDRCGFLKLSKTGSLSKGKTCYLCYIELAKELRAKNLSKDPNYYKQKIFIRNPPTTRKNILKCPCGKERSKKRSYGKFCSSACYQRGYPLSYDSSHRKELRNLKSNWYNKLMDKNHGLLVAAPRPADYILGVSAPIGVARYVADWTPFLPTNESQNNQVSDFLDCVTMSAIHGIESNLNYLLSTSQLSDEALNFFNNGGYIVNGKFKLSSRFNAKMNGTDVTHGQYLGVAGDCFRRDGILPESDWPTTQKMDWAGFYAPIPQALVDKAKVSRWFISISYQYLDRKDIPAAIKASPVQIATEVCSGWDNGQIVARCSGLPLSHATLIYGLDSSLNYLDLDQYPPYRQVLASDYELPLNMQYLAYANPIALRIGMTGKNVKVLQHNLNLLGYPIPETGYFGSITQSKVVDFQNKNGLNAEGLVGPLTLSKIKELLNIRLKTTIQSSITDISIKEGVEPALAIAVATAESGLNPNCVNVNIGGSRDRGLFQWNDKYHPEITDAMAFDPETSTRLFCQAVKNGKLVAYWSASMLNWKKMLSMDILKKYGVQ